jgi:hypothetical protein
MHGVEALARRIVRLALGLCEIELRVAYLRALLAEHELAPLAQALDHLAAASELGDPPSRGTAFAVVSALSHPTMTDVAQRLREEAAGESLVALERMLRRPLPSVRPSRPPSARGIAAASDGRPLTLGERKSLARRPDRHALERLAADPHPDVVRQVLANPRLTEDDVVRLAAKRPANPQILAEIVRCVRWVQRGRVRMALVLNPDTPQELAAPICGMLLRHELKLVVEMTHVPTAVRALCYEHLTRRIPRPPAPKDSVH